MGGETSADATKEVDVERVLEGVPLRGTALFTAFAMAAVLIADGFDIILLGYVAPAVSRDFGLGHGGLGAVLTASLIGVAAGGFAGGWLGDRFGRRALVAASLITFGAATLVSAVANDIATFSAARLVAGLGLGAATPNAAALMAEVLPAKWRTQIITIAYASSTLGTIAAGILAREMLEVWGWRGLFIVGAILPLVVCVLLVPFAPESPRFLASRNGQRTAAALNRLLGRKAFTGDERFTTGEPGARRGSIRDLFSAEYRRDTFSLWFMIFMILFAWVAVGNWGTVVMTTLGHSLTDAVSVMVGFNFAGLVGAVCAALTLRRFGSRRIFALLAISAALASLALAVSLRAGPVSLPWLAAYFVLVGAALTALLQASYPVATQAYPTSFRATGVGSAFGFGRLGAVSSSALTAALIAAGGTPLFFLGVATAAAAVLAFVLLLRRHLPPR